MKLLKVVSYTVFILLLNLNPDGLVPYDGVPIEEIETVAVPLTVIYSFLATAGIIFAIVCLVFILALRKKK